MSLTILGGGSPLNKLAKIETHLSRNSRTVYVELDGDDVKGDGSQERPFKTIERAMLEKVGTTLSLTIVIGDGVHDINYFFQISFGAVKITGLGSVRFGVKEMEPRSSLVSVSTSGVFWLDVAATESANATVTKMFAVSGNGRVMLWGESLTLNNVTASVISSSWGQNTFYVQGCHITSANPISKIMGVISDLATYEASASYTNITG